MEAFVFPDSTDDRKKGRVLDERRTRNRLADISNLQPNPKSSKLEPKQQEIINKDSYEKLQKENAALVRIVAEKNVELQKMRTGFQKLQQQNAQLALANSQLLAEHNVDKERLKVLQHELGLKTALRKIQLGLEEKGKSKTCVREEEETFEGDEATTSLQADCKPDAAVPLQADAENHTTNRKRQSRDPSLDSPGKQGQAKENVDRKRRYSRRQSANFKSEDSKPPEDAFNIDAAKASVSPLCDDPGQDNCPTSSVSSVKTDDGGNTMCRPEVAASRRSSMRQAAKKVESYKERPIKIKMRR